MKKCFWKYLGTSYLVFGVSWKEGLGKLRALHFSVLYYSSRVIARPLEIRHLLFKSLLCLTAIDSSIPYQGCRGRREEGWDVCHSGIVTEVSPNITINNVTCTRVKLLDHRNLEVRALAQTPAGEREMCACAHIAYINKGYPPDMATLVLNVHTGNTVCRRCQGGTKKGIA